MRRHATPILLALFISAGCFSEQAQEKAIWEERGYVSVGSGIGLTVPLGRIGEVMEPGWSMEVRAAYHLNLPWGGLGFGFLTGVISQTASDEASSPYNMSSVPLGVSLRYDTRFLLPFYVSVEFQAGAVVSMFGYRDSFYSERNGTYTRLFVAPALGVGLYLDREIGVSIWESFPIIAFGGTPYIGSTTGIRIEYYL